MKDPKNKKKWIIDHEAAAVVKDVFEMCLEGKGNEKIFIISVVLTTLRITEALAKQGITSELMRLKKW